MAETKQQPKWTDPAVCRINSATEVYTNIVNTGVETWEIYDVTGIKTGVIGANAADQVEVENDTATFVAIELNGIAPGDYVDILSSQAVDVTGATWAPGTQLTVTCAKQAGSAVGAGAADLFVHLRKV